MPRVPASLRFPVVALRAFTNLTTVLHLGHSSDRISYLAFTGSIAMACLSTPHATHIGLAVMAWVLGKSHRAYLLGRPDGYDDPAKTRCQSAFKFDPAYCRIRECYPDGAIG